MRLKGLLTGALTGALVLTAVPTLANADEVDTVKPTATLVSPASAGPLQGLSIQVDAADDQGLNRIVANIYKDGSLLKSTQSPAGGAVAASHSVVVPLADGTYSIRYNASDLAGNVSSTGTFAVTLDATAPTVTVKDGATHALKSFKLYDAGKIDRFTLNGVARDLSDNVWSDINNVKPGAFGAIEGNNTLVVFDKAGNSTTTTFWLDTAAPAVSFVSPAAGALLRGTVPVKVDLYDANVQAYNLRVDSAGLQYFFQATNGVISYDLDTTTLSDGVHTLLATATDKVGQKSTTTIKVTVDNTAPTATFTQQWQAKEGGRVAVTATFSEPLAAAPGQGWYGTGTTFTKVYYSAKSHTISFDDIAGNTGTGSFTVDMTAPAS